MKLEFNNAAEYETFRRVMAEIEARSNESSRRRIDTTAPFTMAQEQELLHKPEIGVTRFSDGVPRATSSVSDAGYPYGSTRWLWGVDIAGDVVTVGAGAIMYNGAVSTCSAADVTVTADTQYIAWKYTLSTGTLAIDTTPTASPSVGETGILRGTLYKITSTAASGSRVVTGVQPWQFNFAVPPFVPAGTAEGQYIKWNNANKMWEVFLDTTKFPYGSARWLWGVDVAGDEITVGAGVIQYNGTLYNYTGGSVTIDGTTKYINWKFSLSSLSLTIETSGDPAVNSTGYIRGTLYKVTATLTGGDYAVTDVQPWQYNYAVAPFMPAGSSTNKYLQWNDTNKVWEAIAATATADKQVLVDMNYDTSSHEWVKTFATLTVLAVGSNSNSTETTATAHTLEHP